MDWGTGFFIALGCGLGMGLNGYSLLNAYVLIAAVIISLAHVITKSEPYLSYKDQLLSANGTFGFKSIAYWIVLQTIVSAATIILTNAITQLIMKGVVNVK